jgi:hypothetical protein
LIALLAAGALAVGGYAAIPASAGNPTQDCEDAVSAAVVDRFGSKDNAVAFINDRLPGPGTVTVAELDGFIRDICD